MHSRVVRRIRGHYRLPLAGWRARLPVLLVAGLAAVAATAPAAAEPRHAAMIVDANTGAVLHAQAADDMRHPASLTKMMTLYMAFELIELGRLNYATKIKVTQEAVSAAPTKLDLEPGEEIALIDAMKALVTKSANDMAIAIAQTIGGSEANFARLMTEKARLLGMKNTVFRNASGLPDDAQVTTARDMITLALHLQDDFPKHYQLFGLRSFTYHGETYRNHNTLLNSYRGTDGIKTGYTRASGFNLVASVRRDGKHLIGAIFGGETAAARNAHLRVLLDRALQKASTARTRKPALVASAAPAPVKAQKPVAVAKVEPAPSAASPPQPKPAARPAKPVEVASAQPPKTEAQSTQPSKSIFRTLPSAEPLAPATANPDATPPATATSTTLPAGVEVARVRRVMVAPRVKPATATAGTSEPPAGDTGAPRNVADLLAAAARDPKPAAQMAAVAAAPSAPPAARSDRVDITARAPSTFQDQVAALAANITPAAFAARQPDPIAVMAATPPDAPASTGVVAAAAEAIAAAPDTPGTPAPQKVAAAAPLTPAYRLAGPDPRAAAPITAAAQPAPAKGAFQIQIGAYGSAAEAERQLATVGASAQPIVAGHVPVTLSVAKGNRQLYRARFAGFEANAAANACLELRRRQIDCFVMKAE